MTRNDQRRTNRTESRPNRGVITRFALRLVVVGIVLGVVCLPVAADSVKKNRAQVNSKHGSKIAPDLIKMMNRRSPAETVRVVAQVNRGQARLVAETVNTLHGSMKGHFKRVGVVVLDLPLGAVGELATLKAIRFISPDRPVEGVMSALQVTTGASLVYGGSDDGSGVDGGGVTVAVLDSGIEFKRIDLRNDNSRVLLRADFTGTGGAMDRYGHGTHVAGLIAGNGYGSRRVGFDFSGIAPNANLVDLRVLNAQGRGSLSGVIAAIDFAIRQSEAFNIRVLNLSLAAPPVESHRDDPLCRAVERATDSGLVVVVAAGNFGMDENGRKVYGGISSPGICPTALTVGASNGYGTVVRSDDDVAPFSSRGPTMSGSIDPVSGERVLDNLPKPDLVAPGVALVSLERKHSHLVTNYPELHVDTGDSKGVQTQYMMLSGTSAAAGVVSGAVALMLDANPSLTPNLVKAILMYTTQILDGPDLFEQGAGLMNVDGAVRLARALSDDIGDLAPGDELAQADLPERGESLIADEMVVWSQGLIWGSRWVWGRAVFAQMQEAYAQGLIWGFRYTVWGAGVVMYEGMYTDDQVLFGQDNQWRYATWDDGELFDNGLLVRQPMETSGAQWDNQTITSDFFTVEPSGLVWGFRYAYSGGLVWGIRYAVYAEGLVWGVRSYSYGGLSY